MKRSNRGDRGVTGVFGWLRWAVLAPILFSASHAGGLNDTGDISCSGTVPPGIEADSGTHPRQDCRYGRDAAFGAGVLPKVGSGNSGFDFSKVANNGSNLAASAMLGAGADDWACTRDNVTGLIWEVKTNSGLRSWNHTYSLYNSDSSTNGGSVGSSSGGVCANIGRCDTEKFVSDVNAVGLCGASDWRMPTVSELVSIYDYGSSGSTSYFGPTKLQNYWSGTPSASCVGCTFAVAFHVGYVNYTSGNLYVRLVRTAL